jgi:cytochrome P450
MTIKLPPGPKSHVLGLDFAQKFRKDPLGMASSIHREFGDIAYMKLGPLDYFLMQHPDYVKEIFVTRAKEFPKTDAFKRIIRSVDGNGLVASEGDFWLKQRRMINPTFAHDKLASYSNVIIDCAMRYIDKWTTQSVIEIHDEMTTITMAVAAKIFLGVDIAGREEDLAHSVDSISQVMYREFTEFLPMPEWLPLPSKMEKRHAVAVQEKLIAEGIRAQRDTSNPDRPASMLSALLHARDTEDGGSAMSDEQVISEAKTMFNAGHDSTAAGLAWAWLLLLRNPDVYEKLIAEVDAATAGGAVTFEAIHKAPLLLQVSKEALRLYPPAWVIPRQVAEPTEFHGFDLPKGAYVNVFPWVIQRDERWFPEPEKFDPTRFAPENEHKIQPFAWFPFGAGGRACIGRELALLDMQLLMMLVTKKYVLELAPGQTADVEPLPLISLEPAGGIKVKLNVR